MISLKAFQQLKRGDIVLFGAYNTPRIVEEGPANWSPTGRCVHFKILHLSWTRRASTLYGDTKGERAMMSLPRTKRDKREVQRYLDDRLRRMGLNPRKELLREAAELKRLIGIYEASPRLFGNRKFICSVGHSWPVASNK